MKYALVFLLLLSACKPDPVPSGEPPDFAADYRGVLVRHCPNSSDIVVRDPATNRLILHRVWAEDRFLDAGVTAKEVC